MPDKLSLKKALGFSEKEYETLVQLGKDTVLLNTPAVQIDVSTEEAAYAALGILRRSYSIMSPMPAAEAMKSYIEMCFSRIQELAKHNQNEIAVFQALQELPPPQQNKKTFTRRCCTDSHLRRITAGPITEDCRRNYIEKGEPCNMPCECPQCVAHYNNGGYIPQGLSNKYPSPPAEPQSQEPKNWDIIVTRASFQESQFTVVAQTQEAAEEGAKIMAASFDWHQATNRGANYRIESVQEVK